MEAAEPSRPPVEGPLSGSSAVLSSILVAGRVVMLAIAVFSPPGAGSTMDAARFEQIATTPGRPWRDVEVEYPPVELLVVEVMAGSGPDATRDRLAILSFIGDLGTFAALRWGWGKRPAVAYLLLASPLLTLLYWRIDPLFVALAVWGVAIGRHRSGRLGGVLLAIGTLARVWPVVVLPAVGRAAWIRATQTFAFATVAGAASWIAYGGSSGPWQVAGSRGAEGWSADGVVGSVLWIAGMDVQTDQGSLRLGRIDPWTRAVLVILLVSSLVWIWSRGGHLLEPAGIPASTAVAALLVLSPLSSIQYVTWILPWAAVTILDRRRTAIPLLAFAAAVAGGSFLFAHQIARPDLLWPLQLVFLTKNGAVAAILVVGVAALARSRIDDPRTASITQVDESQ